MFSTSIYSVAHQSPGSRSEAAETTQTTLLNNNNNNNNSSRLSCRALRVGSSIVMVQISYLMFQQWSHQTWLRDRATTMSSQLSTLKLQSHSLPSSQSRMISVKTLSTNHSSMTYFCISGLTRGSRSSM